MPLTLLRPHLLAAKNRFSAKRDAGHSMVQDALIGSICVVMMAALYRTVHTFLLRIMSSGDFAAVLPDKIVGISFLGLFILLLLSNIIAGLSFFYGSRDMPLLLSLPVSNLELYVTRLVLATINSSWVMVVFGIPIIFAFRSALDLPWRFLGITALSLIPFLFIPAAFASVLITAVVNAAPVNRLREVLGVFLVVAILGMFYVVQELQIGTSGGPGQMDSLLTALAAISDPNPVWLPSDWISRIVIAEMHQAPQSLTPALLLVVSALGLTSLGYLSFDWGFLRGWTRCLRGQRSARIHRSPLIAHLARRFLPLPAQFRAMALKEARMFFRDPAQCIQLLFLLLVTLVYLYNFRALREIAVGSVETHGWWQTILCIANIALGGCVVAAISTRFVFPTLSLEGQAYWIARCAPLTLHDLVLHKFWIWLWPICILALILLMAGAAAIDVTPAGVFLSGMIGIALSVGIVGLAVGVGATYATFDWDTPTQIAASFGSLVFMLLAITLVMITMIPAALLIVLSCVPGVVVRLRHVDYLTLIACSSFLALFVNFYTARWALRAGTESLRRLER
ncbi:MAG: hypothetical protein KDD44_01340 [Bdellovibrionales bacterium]|nr:hypothetical protein [Bdellovibrionales bacterium]